ncbi:hypothetical protein POJ06DRAFT_210386 [Lipomyces tetrasporus]|uniref:F-box domain-containing protein n=1 Tax=Lipomyces tetrasporus TaxID=54092 RepID=A0AAD7QSJ6_9ASCO|nr:uncharacterized protein POJ06DRAFT_210386 [Lipomyces tetrasporus]KAJ8100737.1 hypothetical protein POJ06DRAFT_210386 [Lipomyces tetrasporus]
MDSTENLASQMIEQIEQHDPATVSSAFAQFKNLKSVATRQQLLNALFANLLPSDIWHLTKLLGERQLFVDIIALLPSEILIIVLSYVSAREVLSWQRVSKRWRDRLGSEFICSQIRRLEFPDEIPSQRPQDENNTKLEALRLCTFRSIATKQSNRLATRKEISDLRPYIMAYWGGRLVVSGVMVGSDLKFTILYELFSDRRWKLQQSRESWYNLTCSEDICAGVTSLGKCKVWNLRSPSTCQERQLLSSNTRDMASSKKVVGVITMDQEVMVWDTEENEELSTNKITDFLSARGQQLYRIGLNADREFTILLASRSIKNDVDSSILIFDFDQNLVFSAPLSFTNDTRLYRPLQPDYMYVTCSGIRTLTKMNLATFDMEKISGFLTSGDSLVGVPFRDSIFMLEGSYLTRLTLTSYSLTEAKWSYYGILFSLDQTSKMFDLQGDGHYICARMESGVLVFSFNLYDYQISGATENGVVEF